MTDADSAIIERAEPVIKKSERPHRAWPWFAGPIIATSTLLLAFLTVPVLVVLGRALSSGLLVSTIGRPVVVEALRLSLLTSIASLFIVMLLGTPLAFLLARSRFPGRTLVETLVDLPLVLPPAVAGLALLLTFGRRGLVGAPLTAAGIEIAFTSIAVILAQVFVAAPYYVRSARAGFRQVDPDLEATARTLGVGPIEAFVRITLPLALPAISGGAVLAWAKALGEFGATILFAGSLIGRTQTLPLAIYQALESDLDAALTIAGILVVFSFGLIGLFRRLTANA